MSKHTPGPWRHYAGMVVRFGENGANICELSEPRAVAVVEHKRCRLGSPNRDEAQANARLIAAAPELLEACNAVLAHDLATCEKGATPEEKLQWFHKHMQEEPDIRQQVRAAIAKATAPTLR